MDARFLLELNEHERNVVLRALEDLARNTLSETFRDEVSQLRDRVENLEEEQAEIAAAAAAAQLAGKTFEEFLLEYPDA